MIFIETTVFTRNIGRYLSEEEYTGLQFFLADHPDAGVVMPGSGGVRKLRWSYGMRGKRGGLRIIYYWKRSADEIWMLTLYAKSEESNIPGHVLRRIREEIDNV